MAEETKQRQADATIKVGMVGSAAVGKTSLMVKYVENKYDEDYNSTLGVSFMEKPIKIKNKTILFSLWDLGGKAEFMKMLPLVCDEAEAILFLFDLTRLETLGSVRQWYKHARANSRQFQPYLIGTKYDLFVQHEEDYQKDVTNQARKYAKSMKAPLIFCSVQASINIKKIFNLILSRYLGVNLKIEEITAYGYPILQYSGWRLQGDAQGTAEKEEDT